MLNSMKNIAPDLSQRVSSLVELRIRKGVGRFAPNRIALAIGAERRRIEDTQQTEAMEARRETAPLASAVAGQVRRRLGRHRGQRRLRLGQDRALAGVTPDQSQVRGDRLATAHEGPQVGSGVYRPISVRTREGSVCEFRGHARSKAAAV
jgi:hypothetical protein